MNIEPVLLHDVIPAGRKPGSIIPLMTLMDSPLTAAGNDDSKGASFAMLLSIIILTSGSVMALDNPLVSTAPATFVESDVVVSTAAPKRVEPPLQVHLPEAISTDREWRGVQCGVTEPRQAVFRHSDKWAIFWKNGLVPYSAKFEKIPVIDFDKNMVVGVFLGEKDYPYFEIEIRSVKTEDRPGQGKVLVVRYREIEHMSGVFTPAFSIQPFDMKKVPAFNGRVEFLQVKR